MLERKPISMSRTASPGSWLATLTLAIITTIVPTAAEAQEVLPVNPRATYLHTANADANALPAIAIDLTALGLQPGDPIRLE
ncbi:MAG: hypothetical protein K0Q72_1972, partial [Armatimonadetes bacterium]|nr:hypothetical protein [Armatimonadota bacterium]